MILSWWANRALTAWIGSAATFLAIDGVEFTVDATRDVVFVTGGLGVFCTLCFALGPAWRLSRPSLTSDLKDEPESSVRRFGSGTVLVGIQLTVSLALLAVGGLFVRSPLEAVKASPGFALGILRNSADSRSSRTEVTPDEDERAVGVPSAAISEPLARRIFAGGDSLGRQVTLRRGSVETGGRGNAKPPRPSQSWASFRERRRTSWTVSPNRRSTCHMERGSEPRWSCMSESAPRSARRRC
jgi:uncharacterized protein YjeT (DUF2065 family)